MGQIFKIRRTKFIKMDAVILLSGGQDSTTCLYWAKKQFDKVYAVGFDYGQMHVKELEQATRIGILRCTKDVRVVLGFVDLNFLFAIDLFSGIKG